MKKNYFKKSLSLILTVLMLMSCWVFVPGEHQIEAEAALAYGMSAVNGASKQDKTFSDWRTNSTGDQIILKYPSVMYMDISEDLKDTGYSVNISTTFGSGSDYTLVILPAFWGGQEFNEGGNGTPGTKDLQGQTELVDNFDNFGLINGDLPGYYDNWSIDDGNISLTCGDPANNIGTTGINASFSGKPTKTGTFTYDGSKAKGTGSHKNTPLTGVFQKKNGDKKYPGYSYFNDVHQSGAQTSYAIIVYDKAPLKEAINNAQSFYNTYYSNYNAYVLNNGFATLKNQIDAGNTMLKTREVTPEQITAQITALNNAITNLQFKASNADLIAKVASISTVKSRAGYNTLYTEVSRNALDTAVSNAASSSYYTGTTIYSNTNNDAISKLNAERTAINNLISGIDAAINGLVRKYDIGYDNLFSLSDWALNPVKNGVITAKDGNNTVNTGTIEVDADNGTIKIVHNGGTVGTDNNTSQQPSYYKAKVKGNTEYVLTWETAGEGNGQIHVFYTTGQNWTYVTYGDKYNSGSHWFVSKGDLPYSSNMGKHEVVFTTLPETDGLVFRFGTCNSGDSITFSNIRLVEKSVYDSYAKNYGTIRQAFEVGETKNLTFTPVRDGYVFDGWFTADGTKVTNVAGFSASDVVYARWSQKYIVTFKNWDGTVLKTQEVGPGDAATAPTDTPTKAPTKETEYAFDGWDKDFSNIQGELTVTATFRNKAHSFVKTPESMPNCTNPGTYTQYCSTCTVKWTEVFEDDTQPALGHTFNRANPTWTVLTGEANWQENTHTVRCKVCTATTTKPHEFKADPNHPASTATCKVPGKIFQKCDCYKENVVETGIDPNNHVNKEVKGIEAAACNKPGYTGDTWCLDCDTKIATGSETAALEHIFETYIDQGDATCDKAGTEVATCEREGCNETDSRSTGKKREHSFTNYIDQGDATCDKEGTEIATCDYADCDETASRSTGKKRAHKFDGTAVSDNNGKHSYECSYADCTVLGEAVACTYGSWTTDNATTHSHTCTACGYTPVAEAHSWTSWSTIGGSNTSAAQQQTRECTVCGKVETTDCDYKLVNSIPETCDAAEILTYECTICKHGYTTSGKGPKGHNFVETAGVISYGNGQHAFACSNNCGKYGVGASVGTRVPCSDWTYENVEFGKHTATCGTCDYVKTEDCSGGEATCTAPAECQYCGEAHGKTADHSYTCSTEYLFKATDATCTANETYFYYCAGCKQTAEGAGTYEKPDSKAPHNYDGATWFDGAELATQAQCGVNETYYKYCSACKASSKGTEAQATFEKLGTELTHNYDGTLFTSNEDGTHVITCSQSNDTWTCDSKITANCVDSALSTGGEEATCISQGYTRYQCALCGYNWEDNFTPALGHDYTQKITDADHLKDAANCEHANIYYYDCSRCDKSAKDVVDGEVYTGELTYTDGKVRAHDWQNVTDEKYLAKEATCTAAAWYYASCGYEDCAKSAKDVEGDTTSRTFPSGASRGHDWVRPADEDLENFVATPADCATDATYYFTCSRADECGYTTSMGVTNETWTKENSKTDHSLKYTAAVEATCYDKGNLEYWYCERCDKYFKDEAATETYRGKDSTETNKRNHIYVDVAMQLPTCEKDGHPAYKVCQYDNCAYNSLPEVIPDGYKATGHKFNSNSYYYDSVNNYHARYCSGSNCDGVTLIDAEGNEYKVKAFGIGTEKYTVEYDGLDYVITGGEKCTFVYSATTSEDGIHTHANACVCGNNTSKSYSDDETFVKKVEPTCLLDGYDQHACPDENCDAEWKKNIVKTKGHNLAETATTNNDGTHSVKCSDCDYTEPEEKCSGGKATCKDQAICDKCKAPYGATVGHTYEAEWVYQNDAACNVNGTEKNICSICKSEVVREAAGTALKHKMTEFSYEVPERLKAKLEADNVTIVKPTCAVEGLSIRYCENCDYYEKMRQPKDTSEHEWTKDADGNEVWEIVSGNCSIGYTVACSCAECGATKSDRVEGDHEWTIFAITRNKCGKYDYIEFMCTKCTKTVIFDDKYTYTDEEGNKHGYLIDGSFDGITVEDTEELVNFVVAEGLKIGEHSWSEYKVTKDPTCSREGRKERTCVKCGAEEKEPIAPIEGAHDINNYGKEHYEHLIKYAAKEATCTIDGNNEYFSCRICGTDIGKVVEKAPGHIDADADGVCDDEGCNKKLNNAEEKKDGCICHRDNGFMKFIYKILSAFWKLFKINKTCSCGDIHY